eukprot:TRINITY_DN17803_c0_g1_i1.p1 TRINITY_DN17803_c0_g1~~TRINITY_DN17803_c0_g1_i1.p1  ORF type:complete len:184 (-),score=43.45 TRINITY_DN17803_c0_g1_i1:78-605(-)
MGIAGFSCRMKFPSFVLVIFFQLGKRASAMETENNPCPHPWVQATSYDMGCILFSYTMTLTWEQANVYCNAEENATLVKIRTAEQLEFLQMELYLLEESVGKYYWWTAGTDIGSEGNWYYAGSFTSVPEFVWHAGQPIMEPLGNCLSLYSGYGYEGDDIGCSYEWYPICQKVVAE